MATVHVGSVWNLQDCMRLSVPIKCVSRIFYPGDTGSGEFRVLSKWSGNMNMLPVSHKLTEAAQFFQDHDQSHHLWWSWCNWWSGVMGGSTEVTWRHNPFFANNSRQYGDRDAQMVTNDLARQAASEDMHSSDLLGSWPDIDLTWPKVKFWNCRFKVEKYMIRTGSKRRTRLRQFHFHVCHQKSYQWKPSPRKTNIFYLMTSGAKTVKLR